MRKKMLLLLMTGWTAAYGADYNIVDYGAKPDTTILCTSALQQAIDDCSRAGGGRVVVPAGMYKTGSIRLKSHVCLYLEQGATLSTSSLTVLTASASSLQAPLSPCIAATGRASAWASSAMVTTARPNSMFSVKKYPISLVVCQKYRIFAPETQFPLFGKPCALIVKWI